MSKTITMLGNFSSPHSSENDYLWTLREKLGMTVYPMQESQAYAEDVEATALKSDYFFWINTHLWETPGKPMEEVLETLRKNDIISFSYHLDKFLGLARAHEVYDEDWRWVQYYFTVDKKMADWMNDREFMPTAFYLPAGVVERDCYEGQFRDEYAQDIIFVGSKGYHPEHPFRPRLVNWLQQNYRDNFTHWGGDGAGTIRGKDLNDLYASVKIVIGDTLSLNFDDPNYFSDRLFDVTGRGGFLIFPYIKGIERYFKPNEEVVLYEHGSLTDLSEKIEYYLAHDEEREKIRLAGFKRAKRDHTYTRRLKTIFKTLDSQ